MSKTTKAEEAEIVIAKTPEVVSIEMSPDQRDEFVQFMKDKKEKDLEVEEKEAEILAGQERVNVRLSTAHYLNGIKYGPGVTEIPMSLLGKLQHQENMWREHELNIFAPSRTYLSKILEGGQVVSMGVTGAPKGVQKEFNK